MDCSLIVGIGLGLMLALGLVLLYLLRFILGLFIEEPMIQNTFLPPGVPVCEVGHRVEPVTFRTSDGWTLSGLHVQPLETPRGLVLFCPEFQGSAATWAKYAAFLVEAGYSVLAFDFRGTGASEARDGFRSLRWCGDLEVRDVFAAIDHALTLPGAAAPVPVLSISRGALAALAAGCSDDRIGPVVADSIGSTREVLIRYVRRWSSIFVPPPILRFIEGRLYDRLTSITLRLAEWRIGYRLVQVEDVGPLRSGRGVLFIHGLKDRHVTPAAAREIHERYPGPRDRWLVSEARHNEAVLREPAGYRRRVLDHLGLDGGRALRPSACDRCN